MAINWPGQVCINPLMKVGFKPSIAYSWIVNLEGEEEELISKCEQTTRQAIRKFKSSNAYRVVEASGSEKDFLTYKHLHEMTYTRTGIPHEIIYDLYHENIFYNLVPQKRCRVFFLESTSNHDVVAAVIILIYKNTAHYWWGGSVNEKDVGINKYLLWEAMMRVKREYRNHPDIKYPVCNPQMFYFEVGGAAPFLRKGKYKGISDYKKCFGCKLHPIYTGTYVQEDN